MFHFNQLIKMKTVQIYNLAEGITTPTGKAIAQTRPARKGKTKEKQITIQLHGEENIQSLLIAAKQLDLPVNIHLNQIATVNVKGSYNAVNCASFDSIASSISHQPSHAGSQAPICEEEFASRLQALCEAFGLREFAIYGRFAQTISPDGQLLPAERYACLEGEALVAEEAAYYLGRIGQHQEF